MQRAIRFKQAKHITIHHTEETFLEDFLEKLTFIPRISSNSEAFASELLEILGMDIYLSLIVSVDDEHMIVSNIADKWLS